MEGGAFINMDFGESEIWGAFIFEDFHTMDGGCVYLHEIPCKFPFKIHCKSKKNPPAAGRDNETGGAFIFEDFHTMEGGCAY